MSYILARYVDSIASHNITVVYTKKDLEKVLENWEKSDQILRDMQQFEPFTGRLRWCDLTPRHFYFLTCRMASRMFDVVTESEIDGAPEEDINDHPILLSLHFLAMAYCHSLEQSTGARVETIQCTRHRINEVTMTLGSFVDSRHDVLVKNLHANDDKPKFTLVTDDGE